MSLFDLQDVCIAIGSLTTLDLPMVVDLIGIYVFKGQYCTLTTTNWFLQALSVIPRGSWGDVARRFIMIRWLLALVFRCHQYVAVLGVPLARDLFACVTHGCIAESRCQRGIGYPRMSASGESSQRCIDSYMHRGLTQSRRLMTPSESANGSK
ncbi:hypothetical protein F511_13085 [Dorcoceras hygrometricum]|uniref:Uncharacterized protein n=1 Tax=Dorcoceras hygrometricum TaxID=472368 RepID=A0A2Z7CAY9_9LAMI|nr:hypothetical protein F511_13085 [Dorcoceras hygrometricum]